MSADSSYIFEFHSDAVADATLLPVRVAGHEEISAPFEWEIALVSEKDDVDFGAMLSKPAWLGIRQGNALLKIHGVVLEFEQTDPGPSWSNYRALLVPRLRLLELSHHSRIFQDQTIPEIVAAVLNENGITKADHTFSVSGKHPKREYLVQYQESDLDFISRLCEHEGIFYFFDQEDGKDKIIFGDAKAAMPAIPGDGSERVYHLPTGMSDLETDSEQAQELVVRLACRQSVQPAKVVLKDYNYRKPSVELKAQADAVKNGRGTVYRYGEHFKDGSEGAELAKLRAEGIRCRETIFSGASSCRGFRAGCTFALKEHSRSGFNQPYLLVEVEHAGGQTVALGAGSEAPNYSNRFSAIPASVVFRPELRTPKPRIAGTVNARVDGAGSAQYAEIDGDGRYKVQAPFDLSGKGDGKASRFMRMAQPYAGAGMGMHFPLHKGTEVLLTHTNGDPDRPLIASSIPNPETGSPVNSGNQTQSRILTGGNNDIIIEDQAGSERILISCPFANSKIIVGAAQSPPGIRFTTDEWGMLHAKKGIYLNAWPVDYWDTNSAANNINAALALANTIAAGATAAGAGGLAYVGAALAVAGTVAGVTAPSIVMAAPAGISALTPSTFTGVGLAGVGLLTPAAANIVGGASAALMAGGGLHLFSVTGGARMVTAAGDIKIDAKTADIHQAALNNISLEAKTVNISLTAHNSIEMKAKTDKILAVAKKNIEFQAEEEDFRVKAKKNVTFDAEENNFHVAAKQQIELVAAENDITIEAQKTDLALVAKKGIKAQAEEESVDISAKKKIVIKASDEAIELECGDSSIVLKKSGEISIKGKDIKVDAGGGPVAVKGGKIDLN